ncbi:MAG: hypothetical protein MJ246_02030 [Clostridia bacterium]|nr:hypothetical protein [Clostridia bacterium]
MDLSAASFTLTLKATEFSYDDGKPLNVEVLSLVVTSPISKTLTEGVDYEISFPDGN